MNNCRKCKHCKLVYRRGYYRFFRDKKFFCTEKEDLIDNVSRCKSFRIKKAEYDISEKRLKKAENDIKYLLEALKNEEENYT